MNIIRSRVAAVTVGAVAVVGLGASTAQANHRPDVFVAPHTADATVTLNPDTFQDLRLELRLDSGDVVAVEGRRVQVQQLTRTVSAAVAHPRSNPTLEFGSVVVASRSVAWFTVTPAAR